MGQSTPKEFPDLAPVEEVVSGSILKAMRTASERLKDAGIRHVLVGGLAVGAYGYPRATKDVDFLVGDEAFEHHEGGLVTISPGVPIQVGNVPIDPISIAPGEDHLGRALENPARSREIPIAPLESLVYLKLKSPRRKDGVDVIEILKAGADPRPVRAYLERHAPILCAKFDGLVRDAAEESR